MLNFIKHLLINILLKGDDEMMAMLFASKVILGSITFDQVPRLLKQQVADILVENGCEHLITEEEYLPKAE